MKDEEARRLTTDHLQQVVWHIELLPQKQQVGTFEAQLQQVRAFPHWSIPSQR